MHRLFEHIGLEDHPDDDIFTLKARFTFGNYICWYGLNPKCEAKATAKVLAYVEDPIANK